MGLGVAGLLGGVGGVLLVLWGKEVVEVLLLHQMLLVLVVVMVVVGREWPSVVGWGGLSLTRTHSLGGEVWRLGLQMRGEGRVRGLRLVLHVLHVVVHLVGNVVHVLVVGVDVGMKHWEAAHVLHVVGCEVRMMVVRLGSQRPLLQRGGKGRHGGWLRLRDLSLVPQDAEVGAITVLWWGGLGEELFATHYINRRVVLSCSGTGRASPHTDKVLGSAVMCSREI